MAGDRTGADRNVLLPESNPYMKPAHWPAAFLALLLLPQMVGADTISNLDSYFTSLYPPNEPGASILIVRAGKPVYRRAFGLADVENDIMNQPNTVFRLGSITKQFTAVAIMLLEQEGKLKISDDITKYLPTYTPPASTVTIENLLTHTSGIPNFTDMEGWREVKVRRKFSVDEMMGQWESLPLEFKPGTKWKYSNSGYYMLGAIIEKASGMPYHRFIEERIFKPLGMNDSFYDYSERIIPNRARGYQWGDDGELRNASYIDMSQPYAAGALASTADDMGKWDTALYTDALLPQETLRRMWTSRKLSDGSDTGYGFGWMVGEHNGHRVIRHGGGIFGFSTEGIRLPDQSIYVAVLSNGASSPPDVAAVAAAKAMLGEPFRDSATKLSVAVLRRYIGEYVEADGRVRRIVLDGDRLVIETPPRSRMAMIPLGSDTFALAGSAARVVFGGRRNMISYLELITFGKRAQRLTRIDGAPQSDLKAPELRIHAGRPAQPLAFQ